MHSHRAATSLNLLRRSLYVCTRVAASTTTSVFYSVTPTLFVLPRRSSSSWFEPGLSEDQEPLALVASIVRGSFTLNHFFGLESALLVSESLSAPDSEEYNRCFLSVFFFLIFKRFWILSRNYKLVKVQSSKLKPLLYNSSFSSFHIFLIFLSTKEPFYSSIASSIKPAEVQSQERRIFHFPITLDPRSKQHFEFPNLEGNICFDTSYHVLVIFFFIICAVSRAYHQREISFCSFERNLIYCCWEGCEFAVCFSSFDRFSA